MHAKIRVVMAVTILNDHIVANLEADSVAVVIASRHSAKCVTIAVLQKDAAAIVAVEVFAVLAIAIERDILNDHIGRVFACQQRKQ